LRSLNLTDVAMATNFKRQIGEIGLLTCALPFFSGLEWQYCCANVCINSDNDLSTLCRNFVCFGPVILDMAALLGTASIYIRVFILFGRRRLCSAFSSVKCTEISSLDFRMCNYLWWPWIEITGQEALLWQRDALVSIEKKLESTNNLDIHPRSSLLLLLNGRTAYHFLFMALFVWSYM